MPKPPKQQHDQSSAGEVFGLHLRRARMEAGLSAKEMAERLGRSVATVNLWETGSNTVKLSHAVAWQAECGIGDGRIETAWRHARGDTTSSISLAWRRRPGDRPAGWKADIPTAPYPLIGREECLLQLTGLITSPEIRWVGVWGPPGAGKTRLVQELGSLSGVFSDGIAFVPLTSTVDVDQVGVAIATRLGINIRGTDGTVKQIARRLRTQRILLVLDGYTHGRDEAGALAPLVTDTTDVVVVVTSQGRLNLSWERPFRVDPLTVPPIGATISDIADAASVRLFVDQARRVMPSFALDDVAAAIVAAICRQVDGLPLPLILAARQCAHRSVSEILDGLTDVHLAELTGGPADFDDRHQSLSSAMATSMGRLSDEQCRVLSMLSLYPAGTEIAGLSELGHPATGCHAAIRQLVDDALVEWNKTSASPGRYWLLKTVSAFAAQHLPDGEEAERFRRRQCRYLLNLAERDGEALTGAGQVMALARLDQEEPNFDQALRWAIDRGDRDLALRYVIALARFWLGRDTSGGRRFINAALACAIDESSPSSPTVEAEARIAAGLFARAQGDTLTARRMFHDAARIARAADDDATLAHATINLGIDAGMGGDSATAQTLFSSSRVLYQRCGDRRGAALATLNMSVELLNAGAFSDAVERLEEALWALVDIGDRGGEAVARMDLGWAQYKLGDPDEAFISFNTAADIYHDLGDESGLAAALVNLARLPQSATRDSAGNLIDAVERLANLREWRTVAEATEVAALLAAAKGDAYSAATLLSSAKAQRLAVSAPLWDSEQKTIDTLAAALRSQLGESRFGKASRRGGAATGDSAATLVTRYLDRLADEGLSTD